MKVRGDKFLGGFWTCFLLSLFFYASTAFVLIFLYEKMDEEAMASFVRGDFCSGALVCEGRRVRFVGHFIEKSYLIFSSGGCVKIYSPSYSISKLNYATHECTFS
ncbi:hypothetical protein [Acidovorax sp. 106]|uniref:hypothetical protein n=1 Tax=Acidovorax sp. 106 TaxID=2135637 RepID=UPI001F360C7D|nr:hypothetical protein [Acidovorax sp. 106]